MTDIVLEINNILSEYLSGNKNIAYEKLKKISKKYPTNEKIKFNLAFMEQDQGNTEKAKKSYLNLINDFNNFNAKINLYNIYLKEKNYHEALDLIDNILKIKQDLINVLIDKAYINYKIKEYDLSKKICHLILVKSNNTKALNIIGLCLFKEGKYKESLEYLSKGLSINNTDLSLLNSIGDVYYEMRNLEESEKFYLKALEIEPNSHQALNNIAGYYLETNNSEKALLYYEKALKVFPDEPTVLENISKTYFTLNKNELAKKLCKKALSIRTSSSGNKLLSFLYFKEEKFNKAWKFFDGRLKEDNFIYKNNSYNLVKNKLLNQKSIDPKKSLLIIREQGVGDEILYSSIYKNVLESFKDIYIEADERLINLFINSFGEHYTKNFKKFGFFSENKKNFKEIDQVLYAGSLGYYFRNKLLDFPKKNYLKINQKFIDQTKEELVGYNKKFKIGISWKSINNKYAEQKSLSLDKILDLLISPDIDFFNLQYGDTIKEVEDLNIKHKVKLINLHNIDFFNDFIKVGSLLKNLDLFITVSNSTAHLAGALGIKTLLIKPFNQATFFYWNQYTNKTPWYPSIDLIDMETVKNKKQFINLVYDKIN